MYRIPPQPLLAPVGYRIPMRGRAQSGPLGPLASRLGYPGGRGRGRGKNKGKGRQRNRPRGNQGSNKNATPSSVKPEEKVEVTENTTSEVKYDITDENWQVISEETDSPKMEAENYVDFRNDTIDTNSAEGFSTFSEPALVISDETETPAAAPTEEITTEGDANDETVVEEIIMIEEVVANKDTPAAEESQDVTIIEDDKPVINVESAKEQTTDVKGSTKVPEKPSPTITAITAPKPSSPPPPRDVVTKSSPYGSLHCQVTTAFT